MLLATVLQGTQHLTAAHMLSTLLWDFDINRAEAILCSGNLNALIHSGPVELMVHRLHEEEILRIMTNLELTTQVIAQRRSHHLSSLDNTVREIRVRGEKRERSCIGMFAVESLNRILADKVLFKGGTGTCSVDVPEILRETLQVGANAIVVYRWTAIPNAEPGPGNRSLADQHRVASMVLGITILDVLGVAERSYWSNRYDDTWREAEA